MEEQVEYNAGKKEEFVCISKMIDYGEDKELKRFKIYGRSEAIERMANEMIDIALTGHYSRFEDSCVVEDAIPYAEVALNALLGESND